MTFRAGTISLLAACLTSAQPAMAAEFLAQDGARHSGGFAGAYFRVPLAGQRGAGEEPRLGVTVGVAHIYRGVDAAVGERRIEAGLVDVGLFTSGRPSLMVGGRQLVDRQGRLSLQGDGDGGVSPWLVGAGVAVLALGGAALWWFEAIDCDEDEECS